MWRWCSVASDGPFPDGSVPDGLMPDGTVPGGPAPERRGIRSLFSLVFGTVVVAVGVAAVVADLTPIDGTQSGSVAVLAVGAVLLTVLVSIGRRSPAG